MFEEEIEIEIIDQSFEKEHFNDLGEILENYEELKKTYISRPKLSKYEKTKVLGVRAVQIKNNAKVLLDNIPKHMTDELDIACEELKQRKIPFILERTIGNKKEYWKLEDMIY